MSIFMGRWPLVNKKPGVLVLFYSIDEEKLLGIIVASITKGSGTFRLRLFEAIISRMRPYIGITLALGLSATSIIGILEAATQENKVTKASKDGGAKRGAKVIVSSRKTPAELKSDGDTANTEATAALEHDTQLKIGFRWAGERCNLRLSAKLKTMDPLR